jgi:hypothetical protein
MVLLGLGAWSCFVLLFIIRFSDFVSPFFATTISNALVELLAPYHYGFVLNLVHCAVHAWKNELNSKCLAPHFGCTITLTYKQLIIGFVGVVLSYFRFFI